MFIYISSYSDNSILFRRSIMSRPYGQPVQGTSLNIIVNEICCLYFVTHLGTTSIAWCIIQVHELKMDRGPFNEYKVFFFASKIGHLFLFLLSVTELLKFSHYCCYIQGIQLFSISLNLECIKLYAIQHSIVNCLSKQFSKYFVLKYYRSYKKVLI